MPWQSHDRDAIRVRPDWPISAGSFERPDSCRVAIGSWHTLAMRLGQRQVTTPSWTSIAKHRFPYLTHISSNDLVFINVGYEEDPPVALPLNASDEPDRYFIQLYHRTAAQVDLAGKRVLEVSCGHGGGASYLVRAHGPASYTGLDLNSAGIDFCRKRHNLVGLDFVDGDALDLPFPDQTFDAVVNIQASFAYPSLPQFLSEVARVLRPGGYFLYADRRRQDEIAKWEQDLRDIPMRLVSEQVITEQVALGLEKNAPRLNELSRFTPAFAVKRGVARACRNLRNDRITYRVYSFAKE
jgi:ubiquinone/menaquinone biosynthesis C-methylase UbiE